MTRESWTNPGKALLRPSPRRALGRLIQERTFTYGAYARFLDQLTDDRRYRVVPLRGLPVGDPQRTVIGLRHDVDDRLGSALRFGRLEYERGLTATYFLLHSAAYYRHDPGFLRSVRTLQDDYGHEIGWHNDLVTLECVRGIDSIAYLHDELAWLRSNGISVTGTAAHGARECYEHGYSNIYFFADFPEVEPGLPNRHEVTIGGRTVAIPSARLADFGLAYEATRLRRDRYFSDAAFDARGRRWHPSLLGRELPAPGRTTIILTHACLWDSSAPARIARESVRLAGRSVGLATRRWTRSR